VYTETILLEGHILDSHTLSKVLDRIIKSGAGYEIMEIDVGKRSQDTSRAKLFLQSPEKPVLDALLAFIKSQGGVVPKARNVSLEPAPADGVFPEGFYSTTNLETHITVDGREIRVEGEAMDLGIAVDSDRKAARVIPMDEVKKYVLIVTGSEGIRICPLEDTERASGRDLFGFMQSEVSVEKPRSGIIDELAVALKKSHREGRKNLLVLGPAAVHTGAVDHVVRLLKMELFDTLFGGNAVAAHDIENALYSTSLGVLLSEGRPVPGGHHHHLRAINAVRAAGGIRQAIEKGLLKRGIMHAAFTAGMDVFLAGSIRDDGPLPDVCTDILEAKRTMRSKIKNVDVAVMVATALHAIATGNLLPARVKTYCVDINPETVTKLMDRGSSQAAAIVMDCNSFFRELLERFE